MSEKWRDLGIKDKIQYIVAIVLILSGVVLAFLSFALIYTIATGSLIYISQCFITAGGIFGVSLYFKNKLGEFSSDAANKIEEIVRRVIKADDTDD